MPDEPADRVSRVARNELLFRAVNERIGELGGSWGASLEIVCECENAECFRWLHVPRDAIETIEQDRQHFFVLPGHEAPDVETVVERHDDYFVVEKPGDAEELARA